MKLIIVGHQAVNLEQVVRAELTPAYPGGEEDVDSGIPGKLTRPRPTKLELTLTSVHADAGYDVANGVASASDYINLYGTDAERVWTYLSMAGAVLTTVPDPNDDSHVETVEGHYATPAELAQMQIDADRAG